MGAPAKKSKKPSGTKAEQLLEQTTFFVDFCLGKHVGEALRDAGLKIEFHLDHFEEDAPDEEWLGEVGARGWVVLTKDKGIRRKPVEREKVISARLRVFTLPRASMTGEAMAERFLSNRLRMARFMLNHAAPFIAVVHENTIIATELE